ncbi:MAG: MBL fold metallo-hydrolase [Thermomicrobiales bacterium]
MPDATTATYISSRRIGDATVTVISEGMLPVPVAQVFAGPEAAWLRASGEADANDRLDSGQAVILIRHGGATILIDPAYDAPGSAWEARFRRKWPGLRRSPGLDAALAALAVPPGTITHVLITHAHDDHFAGVIRERDGRQEPRFPQARHFIGRADWEGNPRREQPDSDLATRLGAIADRGLLDLVDGDREVVPGVTMLHAPGETPGHAIVRLHSRGATVYAFGDLVHHSCEIAAPDWCSPWVEPTAMRASRDRYYADAAAEQAAVVFTHESFPSWGAIVATADGFQWRRDDRR